MRKPEEEAALEDNYLFSIKAKLELIRNYDWIFMFFLFLYTFLYKYYFLIVDKLILL